MATTSTHLPSARQLGQAFLVAVYTCAMTFFAGLIAEAGSIEPHFADWRLAVQAGIGAGLAWVGWTGITAARR